MLGFGKSGRRNSLIRELRGLERSTEDKLKKLQNEIDECREKVEAIHRHGGDCKSWL